MEISKGFKIDKPDIFVDWNIHENDLQKLFFDFDLKKVTTGYFTADCKSLNGLVCKIGFHFEPRKNGVLKELEFFRIDYKDQKKSFTEFQTYFENSFGKPDKKTPENEGFSNYEWNLNGIQIVHFVFDRFGPEEHMRIKKVS